MKITKTVFNVLSILFMLGLIVDAFVANMCFPTLRELTLSFSITAMLSLAASTVFIFLENKKLFQTLNMVFSYVGHAFPSPSREKTGTPRSGFPFLNRPFSQCVLDMGSTLHWGRAFRKTNDLSLYLARPSTNLATLATSKAIDISSIT